MGSAAERLSGEPVRVISFAESKFVWVKKGDLFFIAMITQHDSEEIYRVILQELAERFVGMYYDELRKDWQDQRVFLPFSEIVELTLQRFDGIPGIARRYKTALLPMHDLERLKTGLVNLESNKYILRGAVITWDAYIIVSTLRTHELEAILDILEDVKKHPSANHGVLVVHTSLDPVTSFFVITIPSRLICVFVVNRGLENSEYFRIVNQFVATVNGTSLATMKKVHPTITKDTLTFYDYDLVVPKKPIAEILHEAPLALKDLPANLIESALEMIKLLKHRVTIADIKEEIHINKEYITEILAYLIAKDLIHIHKIYPVMPDRDERFAAYLEIIGIPKKDYDVVNKIWKYCNGVYSIREISEKTNIPASRIIDVLKALGNQVKWEMERVLSRAGSNS